MLVVSNEVSWLKKGGRLCEHLNDCLDYYYHIVILIDNKS